MNDMMTTLEGAVGRFQKIVSVMSSQQVKQGRYG